MFKIILLILTTFMNNVFASDLPEDPNQEKIELLILDIQKPSKSHISDIYKAKALDELFRFGDQDQNIHTCLFMATDKTVGFDFRLREFRRATEMGRKYESLVRSAYDKAIGLSKDAPEIQKLTSWLNNLEMEYQNQDHWSSEAGKKTVNDFFSGRLKL